MRNKKPTIKQVKEHFKNAKSVIACNSTTVIKLTTKIFKENDCKGINEFSKSGEYLKTGSNYHCVWCDGKYAEIKS